MKCILPARFEVIEGDVIRVTVGRVFKYVVEFRLVWVRDSKATVEVARGI